MDMIVFQHADGLRTAALLLSDKDLMALAEGSGHQLTGKDVGLPELSALLLIPSLSLENSLKALAHYNLPSLPFAVYRGTPREEWPFENVPLGEREE